MRKLAVNTFVSLDGVVQSPGGPDEDPVGGFEYGGWGVNYLDEEMMRSVAEAEPYELLLGRGTYEIFAAFWPTAPKDEGFADHMNDIPKYVVSKTLESASWRNTTVIGGDPVDAITGLKQEPGGDIILYGSGALLNSLIGHDVIDEYRIMVFPVLLGSGKRLFKDASDATHLELVDTRTFESGITLSLLETAVT